MFREVSFKRHARDSHVKYLTVKKDMSGVRDQCQVVLIPA